MLGIESSSPNNNGHKALTERNAKLEWTGYMLGYIQNVVGNEQTIGYYWVWQF